MRAIKDTGNSIIAALDKFDSVGVLDSYFPDADFFTEFERFDRHIEKLRIKNLPIDYVSVCTPNYLHDSHIRFGLRNYADVICEKPLVLNPWNFDSLLKMEEEFNKKVYTILQLRLHPAIIELRNNVINDSSGRVYNIDLTYITSRGNWYYTSWKGDLEKSGGIATNIGVHFFDMLSWIFGAPTRNMVNIHEHDRAAGYLEFAKARVRWFLSINYDTVPEDVKTAGKSTFRSLTIDGKTFEFSEGFTELHTHSYQNVLDGCGFPMSEAKTSIEIVHTIRNSKPLGLIGDFHPFAKILLTQHPFKIK